MLNQAAFDRAAEVLVVDALGEALLPDPEMTLTQWADDRRHLTSENSPKPGPWSTDRTPYLREVMDCLSPSHPCWKVTVKKGAQLGFTDVGINFMGFVADVAAGPMGIYQPTLEMAKAFIKTKLTPAVKATPAMNRKVAEQVSRDGTGSTVHHKPFDGGFWMIFGANASSGLQFFSLRYLFKDELSEWPDDADERGDPSDQADTRTDAFETNRKIYQPSTPGLKGMCRITAEYEDGDQRRYYVPCPHCGQHQVLVWGNLAFNETAPYQAAYVCAGCGEKIEHHHKRAMLKDATAGGTAVWIKCYPDENGEVPKDVLDADDLARWTARGSGGRQPSFWINQLYAPFQTWDALVYKHERAKASPTKMKVFTQQVEGEAYEERGEAPETDKLLGRREAYPLGTLPVGALFVTAGVDVQKDYLQYEVVAWGIGGTSWGVDFGIVEGDTSRLDVWRQFEKDVYEKLFTDWRGRKWPIDMVAIDAGYNTQLVYHFVRGRPRAMAIKGVPGHLAPLLGLPTKQDVDFDGKKVKGGVMLWPVGDWTGKSTVYANLRKEGPTDGREQFEIGYCHFSKKHDEQFFKQLTAEHLVTHTRGGREVKEWVLSPGVRNEALDCRKYALAAAEHLGMSQMDPEDWMELVKERGGEEEDAQLSLDALLTPAPVEAAEDDAPAPTAAPDDGGDWLGGRGDNWLDKD